MPQIPSSFDPVQASTRSLAPSHADAGAASPSLLSIPGQQMQQAGQALVGLSGAALDIVTRMQNDINQTRVDDALNQTRQRALDLTYNPESGYQVFKGAAALKRENGMSLPELYGQKLNDTIGELSGGLDNDEQRRLFATRVNDVATSFVGGVESHTLQEFKHHSLSVQDGAIKLGVEDAKRNWSDPVKIDTALASVKSAVVRAGQLQGESANEILAKMRTAESVVHLGVIDQALQNNNPTYAQQYMQKSKDGMTADDLLKVTVHINRDLDARIAQSAVAQTAREYSGRFAPGDLDRLKGVVLGLESGGKDTNNDGTPLTSPKGAKYRMQVMPDTAKNPGFGIMPARDDSPAEYNRVGEEYLSALVKKYGNVAYALAAYNAGPERVDTAIKKAARSAQLAQADPSLQVFPWTAFIPKETQDYVKNGMTKYGAGEGAAPMPTEQEFVAANVAKLGPNPRPEQIKLTQAAAEHQYGLMVKATKQRDEENVATAMRGILQNGGRFSDLPLNVRAALPPKEVDNLISFGQKISKGDDTTSLWLYNKLTNDPGALTRMSDDAFFALRRELSDADFRHFSNLRAKAAGQGSDAGKPGDINTQAIKQTLDERLRMLNIDPTPKDDGGADAARVGGIRRFVDSYFMSAQREAGKKFSDTEVAQHIDALFAKNATFRGWFSNTSGPMLAMKTSDIDGTTRDGIKAAFKRRGVDNPSDAEILNAYWNMKVRR